jgi:hypothetical protein
MDALDRERSRVESQQNDRRPEVPQSYNQDPYEEDAYPQEDYPPADYQPNHRQGTQKSYMEQKKEELRKYMAEKGPSVQKNNYSQPMSNYHQAPQNTYEDAGEDYDQKPYTDDEMREYMKKQMEYEVAQEMAKMKKENDQKLTHGDYNPYAQPTGKKEMPFIAGGKSIRQKSEEDKFTLTGYSESDPMHQKVRDSTTKYETSSNAYGRYDSGMMSKSYSNTE